jgi:hypothetical protein
VECGVRGVREVELHRDVSLQSLEWQIFDVGICRVEEADSIEFGGWQAGKWSEYGIA